jgi:hypothetical protein
MEPGVITIMSTLLESVRALMFAPRYFTMRRMWCGTPTDISQIMLRNIPNKVDQAMLKRLVDDSSWGKYDFMYLRIDFANDCK